MTMNPVLRKRLPPSVRRLLTDIGPKDEWLTDKEPDAVPRDGILLPATGAASNPEDYLTPAQTEEKSTDTQRATVCMLCKRNPSCYTCPRCNLRYCGLACYQSPEHSVCSEEFYKESVLQELKNMGKNESEGRKKMQEILTGLRRKANMEEGGMESVLREFGVVSEDAGEGEEQVQAVELLSRLAEIQQSGGEKTGEIWDILRELEEISGGEEGDGELPSNVAETLAERLSGLDIDKLSEAELWKLLDSKEKEEFMGLMRGGVLGGLVPLWKPWWEEHEESRMVEVLEEDGTKPAKDTSSLTMQDVGVKKSEGSVKSSRSNVKVKCRNKTETSTDTGCSTVPTVPLISKKIPKLSSLCANPSPLICYSVINTLFCYTFTLSLLNGDTDTLMFEFCDMILGLSEALSSARVFNSIQQAIASGEALILGGGYFDKVDPHASTRAVKGVAHIMTGRNRKDPGGYCLAALSQIRSALSQARAALSKEGEDGKKRQKCFLAGKKCEFFQAWVLDNSQETHMLAVELWNEHGRRESGRESIEKAKATVEEGFKKGKRKPNGILIQELN